MNKLIVVALMSLTASAAFGLEDWSLASSASGISDVRIETVSFRNNVALEKKGRGYQKPDAPYVIHWCAQPRQVRNNYRWIPNGDAVVTTTDADCWFFELYGTSYDHDLKDSKLCHQYLFGDGEIGGACTTRFDPNVQRFFQQRPY